MKRNKPIVSAVINTLLLFFAIFLIVRLLEFHVLTKSSHVSENVAFIIYFIFKPASLLVLPALLIIATAFVIFFPPGKIRSLIDKVRLFLLVLTVGKYGLVGALLIAWYSATSDNIRIYFIQPFPHALFYGILCYVLIFVYVHLYRTFLKYIHTYVRKNR